MLNTLSLVEKVENGSSDLNPFTIWYSTKYKTIFIFTQRKIYNYKPTFSATIRSSTLIKNLTNAGRVSGGV